MRLLEPVPEWRISLRQVMKHRWFKDGASIPPIFDDTVNQLVESILQYMKINLKVKTKDAINAIVSNRYAHKCYRFKQVYSFDITRYVLRKAVHTTVYTTFYTTFYKMFVKVVIWLNLKYPYFSILEYIKHNPQL